DGSQDAYTLFAQSMDRSGYARGTLAVRDGLQAPVPAPDPRPELTMEDMGHGDHSAHGQAAAPAQSDDPHAGHGDMNHDAMNSDQRDHAAMGHGPSGAMQAHPA